MWINRAEYVRLVQQAAEREAYAQEIIRLGSFIGDLRKQVEAATMRAERAIDELLIRQAVSPIREEAHKAVPHLDNIFEEEDPEAVKAINERIEDQGIGPVYTELFEDLYGSS